MYVYDFFLIAHNLKFLNIMCVRADILLAQICI